MSTCTILAVMLLVCVVSSALASEGQRADAVLLNGPWQFARGNGDEGAESGAGQAKLQWKPVTLPGQFSQWDPKLATSVRFVWARRKFTVTQAQAGRLAVLRWNRISLGATAFINGRKVGYNEPTGPYQVILPEGVLKPGENEIVLKIPGAAGVRKAKSGYFLFPSGFSTCHRRGMPAVTDDVWIDFADSVYLKWVLAIPDLAGSRVRIRATPSGLARVDGLTLTAEVKPWPDGPAIGRGEAPARLVPDPDPLGGEHFFINVTMPGLKPWTHEERNLYTAHVKATKGGKVLDAASFRFGMREIRVVDGNYKLNGRNLWLRGSNVVFEWNWGDTVRGKEVDYLVTEASEMSMNCFRTHTQPPPRLWADICDEHGPMILAEFPCLYNYRDYGFTPDEYEVWHRNTLLDAAGWMARLWNHPSVVMWVLSNESRRDNAWETGAYQDLVNRLDPTRPTMRTGTTGTKENFDVHTCGNVSHDLQEGRLHGQIRGWFRQAKGRTVTNSEYMNVFRRSPWQWAGTDDKGADALAVAQIGLEHTEAMRRARVDAILPYMYAGWTRTRRGDDVWKGGYARPLSACWHSSLSPVLASLELFDANYATGQEMTTPLHLINDTWHDAAIHVDLLLTRECPELIPEAECFGKPVAKWSFDFELAADAVRTVPVSWRLPEAEGSYWLTARTTGIAGRPVLSQRFVRAVSPSEVPEAAKRRTFVVLGGDRAATAFFASKGLTTSTSLEGLDPRRHAVIVWNPARVAAKHREQADALCAFAAAGGRIVVLAARSWNWPELCAIRLEGTAGSRAFVRKGVQHPMLRGIAPDWLTRWNGLPGIVAAGRLQGPALKGAKKLLWVRDPNTIVAGEVPAASGSGRILVSQLDVQRRLDRSTPHYDPVAERVMLNLLGW